MFQCASFDTSQDSIYKNIFVQKKQYYNKEDPKVRLFEKYATQKKLKHFKNKYKKKCHTLASAHTVLIFINGGNRGNNN